VGHHFQQLCLSLLLLRHHELAAYLLQQVSGGMVLIKADIAL
jgi:hypothetical protein